MKWGRDKKKRMEDSATRKRPMKLGNLAVVGYLGYQLESEIIKCI